MALIDMNTARQHLRDPENSGNDEDISLKLEQAEAIILGRCNSTAYWRAITPTWTEANVPGDVKSAILLMLTHLYEQRGDNMQSDADLWAAIDRLLAMNKDPVLA